MEVREAAIRERFRIRGPVRASVKEPSETSTACRPTRVPKQAKEIVQVLRGKHRLRAGTRFGETGTARGQSPSYVSRWRTEDASKFEQSGERRFGATQSLHGVPPNMRSQTGEPSSFGNSTQSSAAGWHRFGEPGVSTSPRNAAQPREQSGWHSFGQSQHTGLGSYGEARPGAAQAQPRYGGSFSTPRGAPNTMSNSVRGYGGNYESRPLGPSQPTSRPPQSSFGYRGGSSYSARPSYAAPSFDSVGSSRGAPSMPHYSAPAAQRHSAPSTPHYSAPASRGGGGSAPHGGGSTSGGSRGGHSSSSGHRSR